VSEPNETETTVTNLGVAMFSVSDQDRAISFYTDRLGWELRSDDPYGENGEMRWVEVAPPGSRARLSLNLPMGDEPGGSSIAVETTDARAEHERLSSIGGIDMDPEPFAPPGAPVMFMLRDPDGNTVVVVETPEDA
jgi:predicted enzyme related to lactoylglutathione lyase